MEEWEANQAFESYLESLMNKHMWFIEEVNKLRPDYLHLLRQFFRDNKKSYPNWEDISNVIKNTALHLGKNIEDDAIRLIVKPLRRSYHDR